MGVIQTLKKWLLWDDPGRDSVFKIYNRLVETARAPGIYKKYAVPDTLDGRFDAIVLHLALFLVGTRAVLEAAGEGDLGRDLVAVFLKDMDRSLREIGVGDLSVGRQVKKMAAALYGRLAAYQAALEGKGVEAALATALKRNLYRGQKITVARVAGLSAYSVRFYKKMKRLNLNEITSGALEGKSS